MKNLEQQFSKDLMITQSSKTVRDPIPVDLLIDIISRVPARSVARFRCVSRFWESILGRPDFTNLFQTKSVARPRIFFAVKVNELFSCSSFTDLCLFSSPQPQNPDENFSLVATPYKDFPKGFPAEICTPLYGLVLLQNRGKRERMIFNPITGEYITLPKMKATCSGNCHFGFDPINKQYKVMFMNRPAYKVPNTQRVLTLETGKPLWRPIQDPIVPLQLIYSDKICINGVVYYRATFETSTKIMCFNFRSERLDLIDMDISMLHEECLILFNYKGNLGVHKNITFSRCKEEIVFWVLEDAGKHKWSKRVFVLPPSGYEIVKKNLFRGMTSTGELVYSPISGYLSNPFHIFYYNIERSTFTRFNILGLEKFKHQYISVDIFLDYVENMKFI